MIPDPAIEAAAAASWATMRVRTLAAAAPPLRPVFEQALPERFEDLDPGRQQLHRALARAAVDAWHLHTALHTTDPGAAP